MEKNKFDSSFAEKCTNNDGSPSTDAPKNNKYKKGKGKVFLAKKEDGIWRATNINEGKEVYGEVLKRISNELEESRRSSVLWKGLVGTEGSQTACFKVDNIKTFNWFTKGVPMWFDDIYRVSLIEDYKQLLKIVTIQEFMVAMVPWPMSEQDPSTIIEVMLRKVPGKTEVFHIKQKEMLLEIYLTFDEAAKNYVLASKPIDDDGNVCFLEKPQLKVLAQVIPLHTRKMRSSKIDALRAKYKNLVSGGINDES